VASVVCLAPIVTDGWASHKSYGWASAFLWPHVSKVQRSPDVLVVETLGGASRCWQGADCRNRATVEDSLEEGLWAAEFPGRYFDLEMEMRSCRISRSARIPEKGTRRDPPCLYDNTACMAVSVSGSVVTV
jgi:hypothetical protein